jgi:hypothetical protein
MSWSAYRGARPSDAWFAPRARPLKASSSKLNATSRVRNGATACTQLHIHVTRATARALRNVPPGSRARPPAHIVSYPRSYRVDSCVLT